MTSQKFMISQLISLRRIDMIDPKAGERAEEYKRQALRDSKHSGIKQFKFNTIYSYSEGFISYELYIAPAPNGTQFATMRDYSKGTLERIILDPQSKVLHHQQGKLSPKEATVEFILEDNKCTLYGGNSQEVDEVRDSELSMYQNNSNDPNTRQVQSVGNVSGGKLDMHQVNGPKPQQTYKISGTPAGITILSYNDPSKAYSSSSSSANPYVTPAVVPPSSPAASSSSPGTNPASLFSTPGTSSSNPTDRPSPTINQEFNYNGPTPTAQTQLPVQVAGLTPEELASAKGPGQFAGTVHGSLTQITNVETDQPGGALSGTGSQSVGYIGSGAKVKMVRNVYNQSGVSREEAYRRFMNGGK